MSKIDDINRLIIESKLSGEIFTKEISDGHHTFGELYRHRIFANIEWTRLGHLYRWSYYPYKYATGLLIASVVVDSLVDKKTLSKEDYIKFLSAGSSQYSLDLLKILNIDLVNTDIIESGFNVMAEDIKLLQKIISLKKERKTRK